MFKQKIDLLKVIMNTNFLLFLYLFYNLKMNVEKEKKVEHATINQLRSLIQSPEGFCYKFGVES